MATTLLIYTSIIAVTLFFAGLGVKINGYQDRIRPDRSWRVRLCWFFAVAYYVLILGTRYEIGVDYNSYRIIFTDLIAFGNAMNVNDPIFYLFRPWVQYGHYNLFIALLAFIHIFFIFKISETQTRVLPFWLLFFFCTGMFLDSLNLMRQMAAYFIVFYALLCFYDGRYKSCLAWFAVAFLFHRSCVVFLLFPFLLRRDVFKFRPLQYALLFFCFFFGQQIFDVVLPWMERLGLDGGFGLDGAYGVYVELNDRMLAAQETLVEKNEASGGTNLMPWYFLFVNCVVVFYSSQLKKRLGTPFTFFYTLFFLGCLLSGFSEYHMALSRLARYFTWYRPWIYAMTMYYVFQPMHYVFQPMLQASDFRFQASGERRRMRGERRGAGKPRPALEKSLAPHPLPPYHTPEHLLRGEKMSMQIILVTRVFFLLVILAGFLYMYRTIIRCAIDQQLAPWRFIFQESSW